VKIVGILLDAGASVSVANGRGLSAMQCAAEAGHGDVVQVLLSRVSIASVNTVTWSGAAAEGKPLVTLLLLYKLLDEGSTLYKVSVSCGIN
jgi:ankyrin repeat protein